MFYKNIKGFQYLRNHYHQFQFQFQHFTIVKFWSPEIINKIIE